MVDSHGFKDKHDQFMIDSLFSVKDTLPRSEEVEQHYASMSTCCS